MLREDLVFGPIFSRRLGSSLGINLLPRHGKLCNFDCIYCECGWNKDGRDDRQLATAQGFRCALEEKLISCLKDSIKIDSITFAGDGEPTLNPDFPEIIDICIELRDKYYPLAKISVLTNATKIGDDKIFNALRKVENPILKLDAASNKIVSYINKPVGKYNVSTVIDNMRRFEGDFIMQTMLLKSNDYHPKEMIEDWKKIVRDLKPREIMVYTLDRPAPTQGLQKLSIDQMQELVQDLIDEGFKIQIR